MAVSEMSGKVQTVLGPIDPEDIGITLPHEHLLGYFKRMFTLPAEASQMAFTRAPITLETLPWIRSNYPNSYEALGLHDEEEVIKEVSMFYRAGGQTVVEASNIGLSRDPQGLVRISRATGLNIIMGAGYYVEPNQSEEWKQMSEDAMAEVIIKDIQEGVDDTGIKAGVIGEVGVSRTWTEAEKRSIRASAQAQRVTGAPILVHPISSPVEIAEWIAEAGGDVSRTIMSHLDVTIFDYETIKAVAETGCYIEYDKFGQEGSSQFPAKGFLPNDAQRLDTFIRLIEEGHLNQLVMSHDIAHRHQYTQNGGFGYVHIPKNVVPLMRAKGMTQEQIHTIIVENPKRVLPFA